MQRYQNLTLEQCMELGRKSLQELLCENYLSNPVHHDLSTLDAKERAITLNLQAELFSSLPYPAHGQVKLTAQIA